MPRFSHPIIWLMLLSSLLATTARAADDTPDWTARCQPSSGLQGIRFHSLSGDLAEDDMTITLLYPDGQQRQLALPPGQYHARGTLENVRSLCEGVAAFAVGPHRVLMLLSRDDRPGLDQLEALLVDTRQARVLARRSRLGALKPNEDSFVLLKQSSQRYWVRLVRHILPGACDCVAGDIEDWFQLRVSGSRLQAGWVSAARP